MVNPFHNYVKKEHLYEEVNRIDKRIAGIDDRLHGPRMTIGLGYFISPMLMPERPAMSIEEMREQVKLLRSDVNLILEQLKLCRVEVPATVELRTKGGPEPPEE